MIWQQTNKFEAERAAHDETRKALDELRAKMLQVSDDSVAAMLARESTRAELDVLRLAVDAARLLLEERRAAHTETRKALEAAEGQHAKDVLLIATIEHTRESTRAEQRLQAARYQEFDRRVKHYEHQLRACYRRIRRAERRADTFEWKAVRVGLKLHVQRAMAKHWGFGP